MPVALARRLFLVSMSVVHKGPSEALRLSVSRQLSAGCDSLRCPWMWSWFRFNGAGMGREHVGGLAPGAMGRVVLGCGVHVGPTVMRVTNVNLHVAVCFRPSTADDHSLSAA